MATRVFIVEDDEAIADLLQQMLIKKGYIIAGIAAFGGDALKKIPDIPCDVILMDIMLKGDIDGISVAHILSALLKTPIIFVTGNFDDKILERAKMANIYGYIIKPFTLNDLVSNIEIALFNYRLREENAKSLAAAIEQKKEDPPLPPPPVEPVLEKKPVENDEVPVPTLKDLYIQGFHHQTQGNYPIALQYFNKILDSQPDDLSIWVERGDVLSKMGENREALTSIDNALRIDPVNEYAVCKKCRILCGTGNHADALTLLDKTLTFIPDKYATLVEKGLVLHELGRNDEAIKVIDEAITMDKKLGYALGARGRILYKNGRNKEAMEAFRRALVIEPKNISLWMDLIRLFEQRKDYQMALNILQQAIGKNPDNDVLLEKRERLLHHTIPVT